MKQGDSRGVAVGGTQTQEASHESDALQHEPSEKASFSEPRSCGPTTPHQSLSAKEQLEANAPKPTEICCQEALEERAVASDAMKAAPNEIRGEQQQPRKRCAAAREATSPPRQLADEVETGDETTSTRSEGTDHKGEPQLKRHKGVTASRSPPCANASSHFAADDAERQIPEDHVLPNSKAGEVVGILQDYKQEQPPEGGFLVQEEEQRALEAETSLFSDPARMYHDAWILAPMVRISTLPFRLECLNYGAGKAITTGPRRGADSARSLIRTVSVITQQVQTVSVFCFCCSLSRSRLLRRNNR